MERKVRQLRITGRVQGVWFRQWSVNTARDLDLSGWVRNRTDGTVEAVVAGEGSAIDRFIAACHDGPPAAAVDRVDVTEAAEPDTPGFEQRPTL